LGQDNIMLASNVLANLVKSLTLEEDY